MNWRRGFFRLWIVASCIWLLLCGGFSLAVDSYGADVPIVIAAGDIHASYPRGTSRETVGANLQDQIDARNKAAVGDIPELMKRCGMHVPSMLELMNKWSQAHPDQARPITGEEYADRIMGRAQAFDAVNPKQRLMVQEFQRFIAQEFIADDPKHDGQWVKKVAQRDECAAFDTAFLFNISIKEAVSTSLDPLWERQYNDYLDRRTYAQEGLVIATRTILPSLVVLVVGWIFGWVVGGFIARPTRSHQQ